MIGCDKMLKKIDIKKAFSLLFIIFSAIMTISVIFGNNDIVHIFQILKSIKMGYIFIAVISLFVFWFLESYMIYTLITTFTDKKKTFRTFWIAIKTTMIGQYYSNITPFASGGQPVQLYVMKDENVPLSGGTAVLVSKFLLFQVGVTIYSLLLAIYRINIIISYTNKISFFILTGLTINIIMLSAIILIAFKPKILIKLVERILLFLYKHHIIKNIDSKLEKTHNFISEYETSIIKLKNDVKLTLYMFLITFIQLTAFFSITFFIYKALNLNGSSIIEIICLQSFLYMAVSFIPTPGTAGVSEIGFVVLLGTIFSSNIVGTALILWRGISYYFSLLFSGMFSLAVTSFSKNKKIA